LTACLRWSGTSTSAATNPPTKWLKHRYGRTLTFEDIRHYQRMIVALQQTAEVMEEVDTVGVV
jgi:hypothetical protein